MTGSPPNRRTCRSSLPPSIRRTGISPSWPSLTRGLTVRLSSKNDRFIRSTELFEAILKDFTQDAFNISRENPYAVRYYDEKTARGVEQVKFYIFISRAGGYRLLIAYPYLFGRTILVRTALEVALVALCIVILFSALYIALTKKPSRQEKEDAVYD